MTVQLSVTGLAYQTLAYVSDALKGQREGHMLPWIVRDVAGGAIVMYSILASEWPDVRRHLELRLHRHQAKEH